MKKLLLLLFFPSIVFSQEYLALDTLSFKHRLTSQSIIYEAPTVISKRMGIAKRNSIVTVEGYNEKFWYVSQHKIKGFIHIQDIKTPENVIPFIEQKEEIKRIAEEKKERLRDSLRRAEILEFRRKCFYEINETDGFDNRKRIYTKEALVADGTNADFARVRCQLRNNDGVKSVILMLNKELGCVSPYRGKQSRVRVTLENGDIITFLHYGKVSCGNFKLIGKLTASEVKRIVKSPIKQLDFYTAENKMTVTDISNENFFIDKVHCIE